MTSHRAYSDDDEPLSPEDVDSAPREAAADLNEEPPVPPAMSPAEIDERAQVVERLRQEAPRRDDSAPMR